MTNLLPARSHYTEETANRVVELVSQGKTLVEIGREEGMPSADTLMNWMAKSDAFRSAMSAAREVAAFKLDEAMYTRAMELLSGDVDRDDVPSVRAALSHLRWRAARMNPSTFGEQRPAQAPAIGIQINTPLDLGQGRGREASEGYSIVVSQPQDADWAPVEDVGDQDPEDLP